MKTPVVLIASALAITTIAPATAEELETGFSFTVPSIAQTLPGLARRMESLESQAQYQFDEVREDFGERRGPAYDGLTHQQSWSVAGANEKLLSLASLTYRYSGGAHGGRSHAALIWDVAEDREIPFTRLFTERYIALSLIDRHFCPALREQQIERDVIDENTDTSSLDGLWAACPLYDEITIAPASNREAGPFTHFDIVVGEYVAGPYAAGTFEIEVPVTPEILELVKPEYRDSFAVSGE